MKKSIIFLLIAVIAVASLAACGKEKKQTTEAPKSHTLGSYISTTADYKELKSSDKYVGKKMGWNCNVVDVIEKGDNVYLLGSITTTDGTVTGTRVYGFVRLTKKQLGAMTKNNVLPGVIIEVTGTYDGVQKVNKKSYPCIIGGDGCKVIW